MPEAEVRSYSNVPELAPPVVRQPPAPAAPAALPDDIRAGGPYYLPGGKRLIAAPPPSSLHLRPPVIDTGRPTSTACGMMNTRGIEGIFESTSGMTLDLGRPLGRSPNDDFRAGGRMTGIDVQSVTGKWSGRGSYSIHPSSNGCAQMLTLRSEDGKQAQYRILRMTRDAQGRVDAMDLAPITFAQTPIITLTRK